MSAIKLLLGILCLASLGGFRMLKRDLLKGSAIKMEMRARLVNIAENEIGVREKTNHNDGTRVLAYLSLVKLKIGDPYCAAFISFVFAGAGLNQPRSGWCPDLFPSSRLARSALPGNIIGIYFPEKKRIAHVGLIVQQDDSWVTTIEANTNVTGSREGDGVYKKRRNIRTIYKISDWVSERGKAL